MPYCMECGSPIASNAKYCGKCGSEQSEIAIEVDAPTTHPANQKNDLAFTPVENANTEGRQNVNIIGKVINFCGTALFIFAAIHLYRNYFGVSASFKDTMAGASIYQCVSSGGNLTVEEIKFKDGRNGVKASISKGVPKNITLLFSINKDLNQAKVENASVDGDENVTKFTLALYLETACGGSVARNIMPELYNSLDTMQRLQGILR
jgi:hypothetical protein